ncbi:hypothetical protein V6x_54590 [Gimesia chilikensis]|uniref:Uncharacterized protein n=1 Tax=Gimesia chilikensis TaxID=2605989 RepID=A0A517WKD6_9PLAN|nr:hypothetical protein V6x_54590 [Gimesia chilikensis]
MHEIITRNYVGRKFVYDEQAKLFSTVDTNKVMGKEPTHSDGYIQISAEQLKAYFSQSVVETHNNILWSVLTL